MSTTLTDLHNTAQQLLGQYQRQNAYVQELRRAIGELRAEQQLLAHVTAALDTLIDTVSRESMTSIEQLVTYGLRTVFNDLSLTFKLVLTNKRGVQCVEPVLVENGVEGSLLDTFGGGPAVVAGFLLRLLVCRRLKLAPLLLLDESFAHVSPQYRPQLAALLRQLAEMADTTILYVTQDAIYTEYATHAYEVVEGGTLKGNSFKAVA